MSEACPVPLADAESALLRRVMACGGRASGRLWAAHEVDAAPEALAGLERLRLVERSRFAAGELFRLLPEGAAVAFAKGLVMGLPEVRT